MSLVIRVFVDGVNRVTVKKEGNGIPTNTLFLTFSSPEFLKDMVSYLKVKVTLFVLNAMQLYNCNKSGHTSQHCKVAAKCQWSRKDKHKACVRDPRCAP